MYILFVSHLIAKAFLITTRGETVGVPSFILFTFLDTGEDLFLFRFLPPLGVFGTFFVDTTFGVCFFNVGAASFGVTLTGDITGEEDLALDLADAGVKMIGVLNKSATPVKLMSRERLLFAFLTILVADFLADLTGDFLAEMLVGSDFLFDFGVFLTDGIETVVVPVDNDLALCDDFVDAGFAGAVFGVLGIDVVMGVAVETGVFLIGDVDFLGDADLLLARDFLADFGVDVDSLLPFLAPFVGDLDLRTVLVDDAGDADLALAGDFLVLALGVVTSGATGDIFGVFDGLLPGDVAPVF